MEFISDCTHEAIKKAARALKDGHLVAFPTETVYGLGADATNEKAVSRIYSVKGRPTDHPLIVHISSMKKLENWAINVPDYALKLANDFWPGPLTLILKRSMHAKNFITGGQDSVGVRVPANRLANELLVEFERLGGLGIAAPSANRFGAVSPTSGHDVYQELCPYLGGNDLIINGGNSVVGIESTIVDCTETNPSILRPGIITADQINHVSNLNVVQARTTLKSPGMHQSHYRPLVQVALDGKSDPGDAFYALANVPTPHGTVRMGSPNDVFEYAYQLYSTLRRCDNLGLKKIRFVIPEGTGLSEAIRDRLNKASVKV